MYCDVPILTPPEGLVEMCRLVKRIQLALLHYSVSQKCSVSELMNLCIRADTSRKELVGFVEQMSLSTVSTPDMHSRTGLTKSHSSQQWNSQLQISRRMHFWKVFVKFASFLGSFVRWVTQYRPLGGEVLSSIRHVPTFIATEYLQRLRPSSECNTL